MTTQKPDSTNTQRLSVTLFEGASQWKLIPKKKTLLVDQETPKRNRDHGQQSLRKPSRFVAGVGTGIAVAGIGMKLLSLSRTVEDIPPPAADFANHPKGAPAYVKRTWVVLSFAMLLSLLSILFLAIGFLGMALTASGIDTNLNGGNFHPGFVVTAALLASLLWASIASFSKPLPGASRSKQLVERIERIMPVLALSAAIGVTVSFAVPSLPTLDPESVEMYGTIGMFFLLASASYPFLFACRAQLACLDRARADLSQ